jgi:hypothetical protein
MSKKIIDEGIVDTEMLNTLNEIKKNYSKTMNIYSKNELKNNPELKEIFSSASKTGTSFGTPDITVLDDNFPNLLLIVEDKKPADFKKAEKEVKHYIECTRGSRFSVIGIAATINEVTGVPVLEVYSLSNEKDAKIKREKELEDKVHTFKTYQKIFAKKLSGLDDKTKLASFLKQTNNELHKKFNIIEKNRAPLVASIWLALMDPSFVVSYKLKESRESVMQSMVSVVYDTLKKHGMPIDTIESIKNVFTFENSSLTGVINASAPLQDPLINLIHRMELGILPLLKDEDYKDDIVGFLMSEFNRYAPQNSRKDNIVLTEQFGVDLAVRMVVKNEDTRFLDNCAGTNRFSLGVESYIRTKFLKNNDEKIKKLRDNNFFSIEYNPVMYFLGAVNFIFRRISLKKFKYGDGINGFKDERRAHKGNAGIANPPFSSEEEMYRFIISELDDLENNSLYDVFLPISMAAPATTEKGKNLRKQLLENNTLIATTLLNEKFFHTVGNTATPASAIFVFEKGVPHFDKDGNPKKKTWLADFRDDGHININKTGRYISEEEYNKKLDFFISEYNKGTTDLNDKKGFSKSVRLTTDDQWLITAFRDENLEPVSSNELKESINDFLEYRFNLAGSIKGFNEKMPLDEKLEEPKDYKTFKVSDVFNITNTTGINKMTRIQFEKEKDQLDEKYLLITGGKDYYGTESLEMITVPKKYSNKTYSLNVITIDRTSENAFYRDFKFIATDQVVTLQSDKLNVYNALYFISLLKRQKDIYKHANKRLQNRVEKETFLIPLNSNGEIYWEWIENEVKKNFNDLIEIDKVKDYFFYREQKNKFQDNKRSEIKYSK